MPKLVRAPESREDDIAARLIAEVLKTPTRAYDRVIIDAQTKKKYRVKVDELGERTPLHLPEHKTFITLGPTGSPCRCCSGSGREDGNG